MKDSQAAFERLGWIPTSFAPVLSGTYELSLSRTSFRGAIQAEEIMRAVWSGKLWLRLDGSALTKVEMKGAHWQGLTRSGYEAVCRSTGRGFLSISQANLHKNFAAREAVKEAEFSSLPSFNNALPAELRIQAVHTNSN